MSPLVALLTDFGISDSYVAEMHAAIMARVPAVRVLDVAHDLPPFDRMHAALVAERTVARLPRGSALVVVVDPGVGTPRGRLVVHQDGVWMVGPDNGVLPIRDRDTVYALRDVPLLRDRSGATTFDGRGIFAPAGALLAAGIDVQLLGAPTQSFEASVLPADAQFREDGDERYAVGEVIALDRYGNAVTNIRPSQHERLRVVAPSTFAMPVVRAYGAHAVGAPLALIGSSGRLELARNQAASGVAIGTSVEVRCAR